MFTGPLRRNNKTMYVTDNAPMQKQCTHTVVFSARRNSEHPNTVERKCLAQITGGANQSARRHKSRAYGANKFLATSRTLAAPYLFEPHYT